MVKIPLQKKPSQTMKIKLGGQNCIIRVYYRYGLTFLDLTADKTAIVKGAICQNATNIIQFNNLNFKGSLHFLDMLGQNAPNYKEFSDRYCLMYVAENEPTPEGLRW